MDVDDSEVLMVYTVSVTTLYFLYVNPDHSFGIIILKLHRAVELNACSCSSVSKG
jgi:hypothetical protein